MDKGIGLPTPRGSGTSGYVQSNKFFLKPRITRVDTAAAAPPVPNAVAGGVKKANKQILEHDRKRSIQLRLLVLQETLVNQGYTASVIAGKLQEAHNALEAEAAAAFATEEGSTIAVAHPPPN